MGRLHRMANHFDDPLVLERAQQVNWVTIHRVCGELAVSRSIGWSLFSRPPNVVALGFCTCVVTSKIVI